MAIRQTVFKKSDAYQWKENPTAGAPFMRLEEYSKRLARCYKMRRENGILEARLHTNGGPIVWDYFTHTGIWQFCVWAGQDKDNEVIIEGGSGDNFFDGIATSTNPEDLANTDYEDFREESEDNAWELYEHSFYDGCNEIEGFVFDLQQPTIGIWNGAAFHSDIFFYKDITLCTEDAWTTEMHFRINMAPGDGCHLVWEEMMGRKRASYAQLTGQIITARKALEYGMVNEIQPDLESAYARAWEIAELIMLSGTRATRRVTTQLLRTNIKETVAKHLRSQFATEMWITATEKSPHDNDYWHGAHTEAAAVIAAEKKGMIVRPRCGEFKEEYEIK